MSGRRTDIMRRVGNALSHGGYRAVTELPPRGLEWDEPGSVTLCYGDDRAATAGRLTVKSQQPSSIVTLLESDLLYEQLNAASQPPTDGEATFLLRLSASPADDESQWTRRPEATRASVLVMSEPLAAVLLTEGDWWALRFSQAGTTVTAVGFKTPPINALAWTSDLTAFVDAHAKALEAARQKFL